MNTQPDLTFPPDPTKPELVVCETASEFLHWCERSTTGEVVIETAEIVPHHLSFWKLRLRWP